MGSGRSRRAHRSPALDRALTGRLGEAQWEEGTLPGTLTVEFGALAQGIPDELRRGPVITYCATGARAAVAASLLGRAGVEAAAVFPGGPTEWRESGRALEV